MKKLLSLLVVLALLCTCAFGVFAEGEEDEEEDLLDIESITFKAAVEGEVLEYVRGGAADNTVLIDGDFKKGNEPSHQAKGLVLVQNTRCTEAGVYPEYSYIVELTQEGSFDEVIIGTYEYYMAMIGLPKDNKVSIEVSSDGVDYDLVGDFTIDGEAENGETAGNVYNIELGKTVTGKFVKFTFAFGDSPFSDKVVWEWHGFTEFAVVAADVVVIDESSEEPAEESSEAPAEESSEAPVEESEETSKGGNTPATGDAGLIALAVVSVIALGGAVIVKKSK